MSLRQQRPNLYRFLRGIHRGEGPSFNKETLRTTIAALAIASARLPAQAVQSLYSHLESDVDVEFTVEVHDLVLAFEFLRAKLDSKSVGMHYTPTAVVETVLAGCGKLDGMTLLDPSCGAGAFLLGAMKAGASAECLFGIDIDPMAIEVARLVVQLQVGKVLPDIAKRLIVGDALQHEWNTHFEWVIGNPPWESYSGRHRAQISPERLVWLREHFPSVAQGWPSLHGAFIERSAHLSKQLALIVPRQVAEAAGFTALRERLDCKRLRFEPLDPKAFFGVTTPSVILRVKDGSEVPAAKVQTPLDDTFERLRRFETFPDEAFGDIGVHSGNAAGLILNKEGVGRPILQGRDIHETGTSTPSLFLSVPNETPESIYFRIGDLDRQAGVPILLRQTARYPIAALNPGLAFRNSVLACFGVEGFSTRQVAAILNSVPIRWFHLMSVGEANQKVFPQVKVRALRRLPLPARTLPASPGEADLAKAFGIAPDQLEGMEKAISNRAFTS